MIRFILVELNLELNKETHSLKISKAQKSFLRSPFSILVREKIGKHASLKIHKGYIMLSGDILFRKEKRWYLVTQS